MPNWEARKICPSLKLVSGRAECYIATTKRFLSILKGYTPLLEVFSIDEVFMDITQEERRSRWPARSRRNSARHSKSLPPQLRSFDLALLVLRGLCDKVARRLRKLGYIGRTVYFGFRLGSMGPHRGKQITLPFSPDDGEAIYNACLAIYSKMAIHPESVSQGGVSVRNLTDKVGYSSCLLDEDKRRERLNTAIDRIRDRFGERAIVTGDTLLFDAIPAHVGGFSQGEEWEF